MKKTILNVAVVLAIGLSYSCSNQTSDDHDHDQSEVADTINESHDSDGGTLVLDDGKPWTANPETTTGVENMVNLMNSFTQKDDVKAYGKLTESLKAEFSMIFQKCTMTGEAHNQLHNFLVPIKDIFETLSSSDLKQCQESYDNLNSHLKEYKKYFK